MKLRSNKLDAMTFNSIADLKSFPSSRFSDGAVANVLGYYAPGDGGGGEFVLDLSSVAADNGGTAIAPDAGSGRWERSWVGTLKSKWFGIIGDGVTDESAKMNALFAVAAKKYVFDSSLDIGLANTVNIAQDDCEIQFNGCEIVLLSSYAGDPSINITGDGVRIYQMRMDGAFRGTGSLLHTARINTTKKTEFHFCKFFNFAGTVIRSSGTPSYSKITNCEFRDCGGPNADGTIQGYSWYCDDFTERPENMEFSNNTSFNTSGLLIMGSLTAPTTGMGLMILNNIFQKKAQVTTRAINVVMSGNKFDAEQVPWNPAFSTLSFCASLENCGGSVISGNNFRGFSAAVELLNNSASDPQNLRVYNPYPQDVRTSGDLITGSRYIIQQFQAGDDFTSSGASSNANNTVFTYNGTPPTWTNSSELVAVIDQMSKGCAVSGNTFEYTENDLTDPNVSGIGVWASGINNLNISGNVFNGARISVYGESPKVVPYIDSGFVYGLNISDNILIGNRLFQRSPIDIRDCVDPVISGNTINGKGNSFASLNSSAVYSLLCKNVYLMGNKISGFSRIIQLNNGNETASDLSDCLGGAVIANNISLDQLEFGTPFLLTASSSVSHPQRVAPLTCYNNNTTRNFGSGNVVGFDVKLSDQQHVVTGGGSVTSDGVSTLVTTGSGSGDTALVRLKNNISWQQGRGSIGEQRGLVIGEDFGLEFFIFTPNTISNTSTNIIRLIFGKVFDSDTLGIPASIKTFGVELRGRDLYGFYSDGTTTTYTDTPMDVASSGGELFRRHVVIKSCGGASPSLHFYLSQRNTSTVAENRSLWAVQNGLVTGLNSGLHIEASNASASAASVLMSDIKFTDYAYS